MTPLATRLAIRSSVAWPGCSRADLRSSDMIGRYGGEEFLIALPDVSPEQARVVIDRIR